MSTAEFLMLLEANLHTLTAEERESALAYYKEYLEEAGENAAAAIEALGSPQSVAQKILAEGEHSTAGASPYGAAAKSGGESNFYSSPYDTDTVQGSSSSGFHYTPPKYSAPNYSAPPPEKTQFRTDAGKIIVTLIIMLCTSPFWLTVLCLWAVLVFTLGIIWLTFALAAIAAPFQGAMFIMSGVTGSGLWKIGGGIFCLGMALLLWYPFLKAIIGSSKGLFRFSKSILKALLRKEEAA